MAGGPALDACAGLGLTTDLSGHFRWGHGFIVVPRGRRLAESSIAPQESTDAVRPIQVAWGLPLSEPEVAARVYEVQIVK
jgi:hypothetical protein